MGRSWIASPNANSQLPNQYREAFLTRDRPLPFDRIWSKSAAKVDDDWKSCLEHCDKNHGHHLDDTGDDDCGDAEGDGDNHDAF